MFYFLQLSDAPQELKSLVKQHSQVMMQNQQQEQAANQSQTDLDQMGQMADIVNKGVTPPTPPQNQRPSPGAVPSSAPGQAAMAVA
jgi:hypothetical protein